MRGLLSQLRLDGRVAWRGKFVHVTLGMSLVFALLLRFALPAELSHQQSQFFADATSERLFAGVGDEIGQDWIRPDEAAVRAAIIENGDAVGVVMRGSVAAPGVTFLLQGPESADSRGLMAAVAAKAWQDRAQPQAPSHTVQMLGPPVAPPPFNVSWLPLLFGLDTVILGFFFAGVMILQEKQNGTVRFYRASPGGTGRYVLSKVLVLTAMAMSGAAVMGAIVHPSALLNLPLLVLLATATAALTLVGMGISVFYDSLSSFFYPMAVVGLVLSLPMVGYSLPSASIPGLDFIPTWAVMFGGRELLFPTGRAAIVSGSFALIGVTLLVCAVGGTLAVHQRLMKERA